MILRGALRSAQYYRTVQYIFQRDEERHQSNLGIEFETFSTGLRDAEQTAVVLCMMEMASVSWFYLFNIQVRANCTTACNIQAALRYVELTRYRVLFFSPVSLL